MKYLFKADAENANTKIQSTNFRNHYPDANGDVLWPLLKPRVRQAAQLYIIPHISQELYNSLSDDFENDTLSGDALTVLTHLQDAIAHYTIYVSLPYMPFVIATSGVQKSQPSEGATAPTHGERKDTRYNAHLDGDRYLDLALSILENTEEQYFDDWKTWSAKNLKTSVLFKTAEQYDDLKPIQKNRRTFSALVPHLKTAETRVTKILGKAFFNDLIEPNTDLETEIASIVKNYVAYDALYDAIPFLTLLVEADGIKVVSTGDGIEERNGLKHKQHADVIMQMRDEAMAKSNEYKDDLLFLLWKNKADLPLWQESDYFINNNTEGFTTNKIITTGDGGVFL